jgi:hypothetical protein
VEALAELSDASAARFMGIQILKQKAKTFLEAAAGNAPLERMQGELKSRDDQIATLTKMVEDQSKQIDKLMSKNKL